MKSELFKDLTDSMLEVFGKLSETEISNCCEVPVFDNTDICSKCKEHCKIVPSSGSSEVPQENRQLNRKEDGGAL